MYIAIVGPGPDIANKGVFSRSCFYFCGEYLLRSDTITKDVEKVIFHVKRK